MKYIIAIMAVAGVMFTASTATALTIPSGSVIESGTGEVKPAHETETGKAKLDQDGYLIVGGTVYLDVNGEVVTTTVDEILSGDDQALADAIEAAGLVNGAGLTTEELVEQIQNGETLANITEEQAQEVNAALGGCYDNGNGPEGDC